MKWILVFTLFTVQALAESKISLSANNEEIVQVIEKYSKATGQKFVIDPSVRGKVTLIKTDNLTQEEAFHHLSMALALNGYAISQREGTYLVNSARNSQRSLIEVSEDLPSLKPERMATLVYRAKHLSADSILKELRILTSKDGEVAVNRQTNQLVMTDWVSNLHRVSEILKRVDQPIDVATKKILEQDRILFEKRMKSRQHSIEPKSDTPEKSKEN